MPRNGAERSQEAKLNKYKCNYDTTRSCNGKKRDEEREREKKERKLDAANYDGFWLTIIKTSLAATAENAAADDDEIV